MNLFSAITSWISAYNALSGTQMGQDLIGKAKQAISPVTQPIQQAFTPAIETAKSAVAPITSAVSSIAQPVFKSAVHEQKVAQVKKPIQEQLTKLGITAQHLDEMGLSEEEKQAVKDLYSQVGVEIPWLAQQEQAKVQSQDIWKNANARSWILENVGGAIQDFVGGAVSEVPNVIGNTTSFLNTASQYNPASYIGWLIWDTAKSALTDTTFWQARQERSQASSDLSNTIQSAWKTWKEFVQKYGAYDPNTISSKVWETATDIWATTLLPWPSSLLWEWAGLWAKVLAGAGEWALQSTAIDIASKWNTNLNSAITGWLVWWTLPLVWAWLAKAKQLITDKLPKSLISSGLMTPSKLLNASERLSRLSDEGIVDASNAPQWLLDKGIQWSKETIQKQLTSIAKDAGKQKVQLFANDIENWIAKTYESHPVVKELQQALTEVLPNFAKVTKDSIIPKAGNAEKVNALLEFITKPKPTALDIDKARAVLWDMGIFTKGGELADSATKEWLQRVWVKASKLLDESLPGFRTLNKDIEVSNAMKNAMWLKEAQDSVRQLMTLTNAWMGGIGATYWYAKEWDVKWALKWATLWLWAKYLFNNPAVTSFVAQKLKALWKESLITKVIKSPGSQKLIRWSAIQTTKKLIWQ